MVRLCVVRLCVVRFCVLRFCVVRFFSKQLTVEALNSLLRCVKGGLWLPGPGVLSFVSRHLSLIIVNHVSCVVSGFLDRVYFHLSPSICLFNRASGAVPSSNLSKSIPCSLQNLQSHLPHSATSLEWSKVAARTNDAIVKANPQWPVEIVTTQAEQ